MKSIGCNGVDRVPMRAARAEPIRVTLDLRAKHADADIVQAVKFLLKRLGREYGWRCTRATWAPAHEVDRSAAALTIDTQRGMW